MNPFSYVTIAIFAALILLSILLIIVLYRCYSNRHNPNGYWAKSSQQNSDEESQRNKQQSLINQQHNNPEIIICNQILSDDPATSDRKLIDGKLLSIPNDQPITYLPYTFAKPLPSQPNPKTDNKKLARLFAAPAMDNFNQSMNADPEVLYIEDKLDKSCCL